MKAFLAAAVIYFVAFGLPPMPAWVSLPSVVSPVSRPTAVVYVYEKDSGPIPSGVTTAMHRLNSDRQIMATFFEQDSTNADGAVPSQYKVPLAAATKAGLPSLVVLSGEVVLKVVPRPGTEADVTEAVP